MPGPKVVEGLFLPLRPDTLAALYAVMDREGYTGDSEGVARFLSDVAGGKLDETPETDEEVQGSVLDTVASLVKKHGPTVARATASVLRSRGRG